MQRSCLGRCVVVGGFKCRPPTQHLSTGRPSSHSAQVTYNGKPGDDPSVNIQRLVGFVGEDDVHLATLTVRETLTLAHRMLNADLGKLESSAAEAHIKQRVDRTLAELHLTSCADTIVGNELLRGVSGGERKRTTFAEMYMGQSRVWLLDKITTGLDSATTVDICRFMRVLAKAWRSTVVSSMLAAPPEAFQTFTHIMLIRDGRIMYHGRRDRVEAFLNSLGLSVPADEDTADFLQAFVSSPMDLFLKQKTAALLVQHEAALAARQAPQDAPGAGEAPSPTSPTTGPDQEPLDGDGSASVAWKAAASFKYLTKEQLAFLPPAALATTGPSPSQVPISLLSSAGVATGATAGDSAISALLAAAVVDVVTYGPGHLTPPDNTPTAALAFLAAAYTQLAEEGTTLESALEAAVAAAGKSAAVAAVVAARAALVHATFRSVLEREAATFTTQGLMEHFAAFKPRMAALIDAETRLYTEEGGDARDAEIAAHTADLQALTITEATEVLDADLRPSGVVKPWNASQVQDVQDARGAAPLEAVAVAVSDSSPGKEGQVMPATPPAGTTTISATSLRRQASVTTTLESSFVQAQYGPEFTASCCQQMAVLLQREARLTVRDTIALRARMVQAIVMALVIGSVFWDTDNTKFQALFGVIFFAAALVAFVQISAVEPTNYARKIVLKQRDALMYSPVLYVLSTVLMAAPVSVVDASLFSIITYFMVGLTPGVDHFFVFLFVVFLASMTMGALFRFVAHAIPDLQAAQAAAGPLTGISSVLAGFLITPELMPSWLSWLVYLSPFNWILRALTINEFKSSAYDDPVSPASPVRRGDVYLESFDVQTDTVWIWYSVAVLLAMFLALTACAAAALSCSSSVSGGGRSVHLEDSEAGILQATQDLLQDRQEALDKQFKQRVRRMEAALAQGAPDSTTGPAVPMFSASSTVGMDVMAEKVFTPPIAFPHMTMAWSALSYTVPLEDGSSRQLLHGIHGFAKPYSMVCLMGASGAGKTTLLDVLAQRKNMGTVEGTITVNGKPVEDVNLPAISAYCEQMDQHMPWSTVRECIAMSGRLRLPETVSDEQVEAFVDNILAVLDLTASADLLVGNAGTPGALPAGARKLLTIGVELASNPAILFLDEPTSGLDAQSAAMVVRVLRRIASQGRSIVCTIHQPSASLFYDFDALLLLKTRGEQVYFGPMGQRATTFTSFLKSVPGTAPLPPRTNVADWMLRVLRQKSTAAGVAALEEAATGDRSILGHVTGLTKNAKMADHGTVCAQWYASSALCASNAAECERLGGADAAAAFDDAAPLKAQAEQGGYMASYSVQFKHVLWRQVLSTWRNPKYMWLRLRILTMLGIIFGLIYSNVKGDTVAGANSLSGVLFIGSLFVGISGMMTAFASLAMERPPFYRETAVNMYHPSTYASAQLLMEVPICAAAVALFLASFYNLIDFTNKSPEVFGYFYLASFMAALFFVSTGQLLMAVTPTPQVAQIIAGGGASLFMLFSGFLAPKPLVPDYWVWMLYVNPLKYIVEGLITVAVHCNDKSDCLTLQAITPRGPVSMTLEDFTAQTYDFDYDARFTNMGIVTGFLVGMILLKMLVQSLFKFQSR